MRIDLHQHVWPPDYVRWLHEQGVSRTPPEWTVATALAAMDRDGIGTGILSVPWPGVHLGDAGQAVQWARRVNEFAADCVRDHPARFGFFATLTLPDVDSAVEEAAYALDELNADGVVLLEDPPPASPELRPLLDELHRRGAVVFVHPVEPAVPDSPFGLFGPTGAVVAPRCAAHRLALASGCGLDVLDEPSVKKLLPRFGV